MTKPTGMPADWWVHWPEATRSTISSRRTRAAAHRFSVSIPAYQAPTAELRAAIRQVLDGEKPAHTDYDLCFLEPAMRVKPLPNHLNTTTVSPWPSETWRAATSSSTPPFCCVPTPVGRTSLHGLSANI